MVGRVEGVMEGWLYDGDGRITADCDQERASLEVSLDSFCDSRVHAELVLAPSQ